MEQREIFQLMTEEHNKRFAGHLTSYRKMQNIPAFVNKSDWELFKGIVLKKLDGGTLKPKEMAVVTKMMHDGVSIGTDFRTGTLLENNSFQAYRKYASQLAVPGMDAIIDNYNIGLSADMAADMNWMRAYRTVDMRGTMSGKITNFFLHATIRELQPQEAIPYTFIGTTTEENVDNGRYGGGFAFDQKWLRTNGFIQFNDAIFALREENDIVKGADAYAQLYANIPATEAFATDPETTFNNAYYNLVNPLRTNKGYNITATTQVLAYYNPKHAQYVQKAMSMNRVRESDDNIVIHNILPIPTFDIPSQLKEGGTGTAVDAIEFVLPGRKIMHLPQDNLSEASSSDWEKGIVKTALQDWYKNRVGDVNQTRRVLMS